MHVSGLISSAVSSLIPFQKRAYYCNFLSYSVCFCYGLLKQNRSAKVLIKYFSLLLLAKGLSLRGAVFPELVCTLKTMTLNEGFLMCAALLLSKGHRWHQFTASSCPQTVPNSMAVHDNQATTPGRDKKESKSPFPSHRQRREKEQIW